MPVTSKAQTSVLLQFFGRLVFFAQFLVHVRPFFLPDSVFSTAGVLDQLANDHNELKIEARR